MSWPVNTHPSVRRQCAALMSAFVAITLAAPIRAQSPGAAKPTVRRPRLDAGADTNSAFAYYMYAHARLRDHPRDAADAYYWAIRLAPLWTQPYYGRAAALVIQNPDEVLRHLRDQDGSEDIGIATADSLRHTARVLDPFSSGAPFDWQVVDALVDRLTSGRGWLIPGQHTGDPTWDAWMAESQSRVGEAVTEYARAIKKYPKNYGLHAARGVVLVAMGQLDSAVTEYTAYLDGARKRDTTKLVRFFRPQAFAEYALGETQLRRGDTVAAKKAYEDAVTEDLSFYMAHVRLGQLAALRGDATTAISEFDLAVQIKDAAEVHMPYSEVLMALNRVDAALAQLQATTRCEPYFALPYLTIARIYDASSYTDEARANYVRFLERAPSTTQETVFAKTRIAQIDSARAQSGPSQ